MHDDMAQALRLLQQCFVCGTLPFPFMIDYDTQLRTQAKARWMVRSDAFLSFMAFLFFNSVFLLHSIDQPHTHTHSGCALYPRFRSLASCCSFDCVYWLTHLVTSYRWWIPVSYFHTVILLCSCWVLFDLRIGFDCVRKIIIILWRDCSYEICLFVCVCASPSYDEWERCGRISYATIAGQIFQLNWSANIYIQTHSV